MAELARRRSPSGRRLGGVVAALALVAAATYVVLDRHAAAPDSRQATSALDHSTLQLTFDLPAFDGGRLTSAALLGAPAVVNFYASWCTVCDAELPSFQAVQTEFGDRVHFVGVNPQSNDTDVAQAEMIKRAHVTYPTARDASDRLLAIFNTTGALPTTVFLDAKGRVLAREQGVLLQPALEKKISELFGISP